MGSHAPLHRWCLVLCTLVGCAQMPKAPGAPGTRPLTVTEPAPGVFVHIGALEDWGPDNQGDVANLGFVVGTRCVAVIDTGGTPAIGQALLAAVRRVTPLPVCYVINTHAHPDHMLGNVAFVGASERPQFVANARYAAMLAARAPYYRNALQRDFGIRLLPAEIVFPDTAVAEVLELDLGGRILRLQAWPTAHTDNDLTVFDSSTRTLFAADLLFVQHLPVLDGNLKGWLCALQALRQLEVATVVPGHGPLSQDWPRVLNVERDYLKGLQRATRAAITQGLSLAQAVDQIGVEQTTTQIAAQAQEHWLLTERFQRRNVTAAYAELEWEAADAREAGDTPCGH